MDINDPTQDPQQPVAPVADQPMGGVTPTPTPVTEEPGAPVTEPPVVPTEGIPAPVEPQPEVEEPSADQSGGTGGSTVPPASSVPPQV